MKVCLTLDQRVPKSANQRTEALPGCPPETAFWLIGRFRRSGQAAHVAADGAKRCKRFGEASLDRSFPITDFRIPAANSDRKARAVFIET
jgi:hypothetical protein